eukprot:gene365-998_t
MKVFTPEISWHQKEPIFSVDFCKSTWRLASAGADFTVKIWQVKEDAQQGNIGLDFLANLDRHAKPVNVVRFSPDGKFLASAGDDCIIIIWKLAEDGEQKYSETTIGGEEICNKETWTVHKMLRRGHLEDIYDLAWSPDGQQLISGSVDNSAIIWDVNKGYFTNIIKDHKHYVQGVCWDPRGQYVATHSSDRSCKIYSLAKNRCIRSIDRATFPVVNPAEDESKSKTCKIFMDETMQSFFRRCTFSPDGLMLVLPGGLSYAGEKPKKATYVFTRGNFNKPALCLPGPKKATVGACFCPIAFENMEQSSDKENGPSDHNNIFRLPYRLCYAVATLDSVIFYDTQHHYPFGFVSGVHYASLTDMTWSSDGRVLVVSSLDGYCSFITFKDGELGKPVNFDPMEFVSNKMKARKEAKKEAKTDKLVELSPVSSINVKEPVIPVSAPPQCPSKDQSTLDMFMTPVRKRKRADENETGSTSPNTPSSTSVKGNGTPDSPYDLTSANSVLPSKLPVQSKSKADHCSPRTSASEASTGSQAKPAQGVNESGLTNKSPTGRPKAVAPQPRRVAFVTLSTTGTNASKSQPHDVNSKVHGTPASVQQQTEQGQQQQQSSTVAKQQPRRIQLTSLSVKRDHSGDTKSHAPSDVSKVAALSQTVTEPKEQNVGETGSSTSTPPKGRRVNFITISSPKFVQETDVEPEIGQDNVCSMIHNATPVIEPCSKGPDSTNPTITDSKPAASSSKDGTGLLQFSSTVDVGASDNIVTSPICTQPFVSASQSESVKRPTLEVAVTSGADDKPENGETSSQQNQPRNENSVKDDGSKKGRRVAFITLS